MTPQDLVNLKSLEQRLYECVLQKFKGNKQKALIYLQSQCEFYARKADSKVNTPYHRKWRIVYKAYNNVRFTIDYYLLLETTADDYEDWGDWMVFDGEE